MKAQWENEKSAVDKVRSCASRSSMNKQIEIEMAKPDYDLQPNAASCSTEELPSCRRQLEAEKAKLKKQGSPWCTTSVTEDEIARIVSRWTGNSRWQADREREGKDPASGG
jgi:ATP-dependent Clp protease ATP-binding subunit ClpB